MLNYQPSPLSPCRTCTLSKLFFSKASVLSILVLNHLFICRMLLQVFYSAFPHPLIGRHSHHRSKLTRANLALHDKPPLMREKKSQIYSMEKFREEQDQYRRFLVTGYSPNQKEYRTEESPVKVNKPGKISIIRII